MAYIPRSSFGQASGVIPMQVKKKHTIRVVSLIGTILMSLAVLATAAAFFYKHYLNQQLLSVQTELNGLSDADNERKMLEIQVYDRKLSVAHSLLDNHVAPSRIFAEIEDLTKQTIQFQTLEYLYDPGFEAEITLGGDTRELTSVALQKMELLKENIFSNFIVSEISTTKIMESTDPEDIAQAKKDAEKNAEKAQSLGVQFEVVGIFEKDMVAYTGKTAIRQGSILPVPEIPAVGSASSTGPLIDFDDVTPSTVMSNDETL